MTLLLLLACLPPGKGSVDEAEDCAHEIAATPLLETEELPDFLIEFAVDDVGVNPDQPWEDGGKVRIEVWDCIDVAWWHPGGYYKAVQVYLDENECEVYETVNLELYNCGAHEGSDVYYRDYDNDGQSPAEGDCDDTDSTVHGSLDSGDTGGCP